MTVVGAVMAVILVVGVTIGVTMYNNYLHQFEIVRLVGLPKSIPGEQREELERQLRLLMADFDAPENEIITGVVREDTYLEDVDEITNASFIIDIDAYQQTYLVSVSWSNEVVVPDGVLISCPDTDLMKYPGANCIAMYNDSQDVKNIEDNPLYNDLPIIVDEFDFNSRESVHYEVRGYFNTNNKLVVVINDYTGGNYENGLNKVRELGYNPEDYAIEYLDQAGNF